MTQYANKDKNVFGGHYHTDMYMTEPTDLDMMQDHLTAYPEIEYVSVALTWIGYGSTLHMDSNHNVLREMYPHNVHYFDTRLWIERDEFFLDSSEIVDIHFRLLNEYPIVDEQNFNELEYETIKNHVLDELKYEMELDYDELETLISEKEISVSDYCRIDNDGYTPYMSQDELEILITILGGN